MLQRCAIKVFVFLPYTREYKAPVYSNGKTTNAAPLACFGSLWLSSVFLKSLFHAFSYFSYVGKNNWALFCAEIKRSPENRFVLFVFNFFGGGGRRRWGRNVSKF